MIRPSILGQLQTLADKHPDKLLYSYLDVDGDPIESYTYASFLLRAEAIAGHLLRGGGFAAGDRLLLAYPPGLEMICAFFGCVRAGLIPVPVYPPSSRGFQSALYKMVHIARDCQAAGILTSRDYHASLKTNLARSGVSTSGVDVDYISGLPWIATEEFVETTACLPPIAPSKILFLQYTSGSTMEPKGVVVSHENILNTCPLVIENVAPIVVSWLPQYHDMGLIGCYLYPALRGGTTYGFAPTDFIQRPVLWFETISRYRATSTAAPNFAYDYCLRTGRLPKETLEACDLSSLLVLMCAAEPVKPDTYTRFLEAFQSYGLKSESFYVAYGLAENTLAVTLHGRNIVSVNKRALTLGKARMTTEVSEIDKAQQIVSCGVPLEGLDLKIVDPEGHFALEPGRVGEIWLAGNGKCHGYWNNPELTLKQFRARLVDDSPYDDGYLRTGDLGFMHEGELYVCGRIKDMIILRGQNYYPHDIENVVEKSSSLIRHNCVAAFQIHEDTEPALAIVAEVKNPKVLPDARKIATAVRNYLNVEVAAISLIAPRAVPRTSSGKIMRHKTKQMWMAGEFTVLSDFSRESDVDASESPAEMNSPFAELKARYNLTGQERYNLVEAGLDSLDLVGFMHELKELLIDKGAGLLARQVDIGLVQRVSVAELFGLAEQLESAPEEALLHLRTFLAAFREEQNALEMQMMREDTKLLFDPTAPLPVPKTPSPRQILLTGGTGFIGPFLMKSLLEQTEATIYVLVRASDETQGKQRLKSAMYSMGSVPVDLIEMFEARVVPVCGDLGQPGLGLMQETWDFLATEIDTVFHNGATVNYLFNYDMMRDANVLGTNEILRLAFEGRPKEFNYISTTFIFGWAVKAVLYETDSNANMELLDFGYSQTKWVAEQVVFDAQRRGLSVRLFRPALVSPSVDGGGNNFDIAVRLVAFMVNHGIGVDTLNQVSFVPADIVANNIVAISTSPGTANQTFHVVRDDYSNMTDITRLITESTRRQFDSFTLPEFVPELIRRCRKEDLLFPLLDFLVGSVDNISSMEFKRYDSSTYQAARDASAWGRPDPSLEDTVKGILKFMNRKGIISVVVREDGEEPTSDTLVDSNALSVTAS
ncbi:thioester reductase domain-containing protein [Tunturibacter empetritectus]|uniref:Thioester reductase-like protein n=1 Tax=Tunturiibacter lichenicola TaxID=2051959 RepID=A0A7W8N1W3_9BACT|nr:thioester reductase domain-containing protein [Edaphobacter lichenicola]MBB5342722.1 thioester reductase-like protein [Edaphobacter lichenicola]